MLPPLVPSKPEDKAPGGRPITQWAKTWTTEITVIATLHRPKAATQRLDLTRFDSNKPREVALLVLPPVVPSKPKAAAPGDRPITLWAKT